jgi:probable F420-dependent oxidoreductase
VKVDMMIGGVPLRNMPVLTRDVAEAGFSGLLLTETGRTAYLACAVAALAADIDLSTGVAVAFPRSPMVTASIAWELAEASRGRFRLGLGTQVRAHIERRYSSAFDPPGPRLREYLVALRKIFAAYRGESRLDHEGDFYSFSLLPAQWSPGPIDYPDPPLDIAAVNPWMLRMAGEWADGVHVHPLNSVSYLRHTVMTEVAAGAAKAGRDPAAVSLIVPCVTAVGDSPDDIAARRETARAQIAFYGSTPNYAFQFERVGFPDTTWRVREKQKVGDLPGMSAVITDDILQHFIIEATWDDLADRIVERYRGIAARVVLYDVGTDYRRNPKSISRWGDVAKAVIAATEGK